MPQTQTRFMLISTPTAALLHLISTARSHPPSMLVKPTFDIAVHLHCQVHKDRLGNTFNAPHLHCVPCTIVQTWASRGKYLGTKDKIQVVCLDSVRAETCNSFKVAGQTCASTCRRKGKEYETKHMLSKSLTRLPLYQTRKVHYPY